MSWFSPRPPEPVDPGRLDAVLAQNIEAQRRAADAADGVAQAAEESREHVEAVITALKDRTAERLALQEARRAAREHAARERGIVTAVDDLLKLPSFGGSGERKI